jgi:cytochrome b561
MSARAVRSAEYDGVAKALHWLVLALLAAQYLVAWTMPEIHRDSRPDRLVSLHVSIGLLILAIVVVRLIWRLRHPVVLIADKTPGWQRAAAQIVHGLLYVLLIALPLMGWANVSARGWRISFFDFFALPPIVPAGSALGHELGDIHILAAYALLAVVGLHVAAALYHHFWQRDRVLLRMLPGGD